MAAARDHQGLQIALIIFVMLTIVLSVTTFIFFSNYDEEQVKSRKSIADAAKAAQDLRTQLDESNDLKTLIGADVKLSLKEVKDQFDKDIETYGAAFKAPLADNEKSYRHLVELWKLHFLKKNEELIDRDAREVELQKKIEADDKTKTTEIVQYKTTITNTDAALKAERDKFNQDREKMKTDAGAVAKQLDDKRKELEDSVNKTGTEIARLGDVIKNLLKTNERLKTEVEKAATDISLADGRITWVNQKTRTVWLDQGTADGLNRQTSFSVIAAEENNPAKAPKKAKVEVTRIQGPHLAEARIVDDDFHNPIMPGDQIMSPIYQSGRQQHFALAGFMDIDGDLQSDRATIKNLIGVNNGVIDAEIADDGSMTGEINSNTRYLVMGNRPTDKTAADVMTNIAKMIDSAKQFGVRTISVEELISQMGYKSPDRVVPLGSKGRPEDFRPRFPNDVQPKAPSPITNFRPRRPPGGETETKKSAY